MTLWCMRIACLIPKATNTHSEYVIFIAFPQQRWFALTRLNVTSLPLLYINKMVIIVGVRATQRKRLLHSAKTATVTII